MLFAFMYCFPDFFYFKDSEEEDEDEEDEEEDDDEEDSDLESLLFFLFLDL